MSALEDIKLEEARDVLGALAILTESSNGANYQKFVPHFIGAIEPLRRKGYVKNTIYQDSENGRDIVGYELTDAGWDYARKVLDSASEIL